MCRFYARRVAVTICNVYIVSFAPVWLAAVPLASVQLAEFVPCLSLAKASANSSLLSVAAEDKRQAEKSCCLNMRVVTCHCTRKTNFVSEPVLVVSRPTLSTQRVFGARKPRCTQACCSASLLLQLVPLVGRALLTEQGARIWLETCCALGDTVGMHLGCLRTLLCSRFSSCCVRFVRKRERFVDLKNNATCLGGGGQ